MFCPVKCSATTTNHHSLWYHLDNRSIVLLYHPTSPNPTANRNHDPTQCPPHLTRDTLYSDDDIIVIDKASDLWSVLGHDNQPHPEKEWLQSDAGVTNTDGGGGISSQSHQRTAQQVCVESIQLMGVDDENSQETLIEEAAAKELLKNLGTTTNPSCVLRKLETFVKYSVIKIQSTCFLTYTMGLNMYQRRINVSPLKRNKKWQTNI